MNRSATLLLAPTLVVFLAVCAPAAPAPAVAGPAPAPTAPGPEPAAAKGVYTQAQAERGRAAFRASCAECHYSSEFRGSQFQFAWGRRSAGDLYGEIVANMPEDAPGSLEPAVYVDIVAYILQLNGFPAGDADLPVDDAVLDAVSMAAPEGSVGPEVGR